MENIPNWLKLLIGVPLTIWLLFASIRWLFLERWGWKYRKRK